MISISNFKFIFSEPCLYCPFRYNDLLSHIDSVHKEEKSSAEQQVCKKCMPAQKFNDFNELLRHTRSYHRKKHIEANNRKPNTRGGIKKLCENCGKLAKHKSSECPKLLNNDDVVDVVDTADPVEILESAPPKKKYVPKTFLPCCKLSVIHQNVSKWEIKVSSTYSVSVISKSQLCKKSTFAIWYLTL